MDAVPRHSREAETIFESLGGDRSLAEAADSVLGHLSEAGFPRRIADLDHTLWREQPAEISDRLGWLRLFPGMRARLEGIRAFAASLREDGVRDVVLLGMGGSSLAPEVFGRTFGSAEGAPRLHVLDSTSPRRVRRVSSSIEPRRVHVIAASKSGTTIEVQALVAHFDELLRRAGEDAPAAFSAITDPGTPLEELARERGFRECFVNDPDIGGRYSALSCFGLVPAAVLGVDVESLLESAEEMARRCGGGTNARENPGCVLGALIGAAARVGRDKLSISTSARLESLGLWIEQLVAESTGKEGRGIVPVDAEPPAPEAPAASDRLFVTLRLPGDDDDSLAAELARLRAAGEPVWEIVLEDPLGLGAEMFRWEYATAVAGHVLGIHPFDQPDVQSAKSRTQEILSSLSTEGVSAIEPSPDEALAALQNLRTGEYVALMVYGDPDEEALRGLEALRREIRRATGVATTLGIGPRFLHSTGQLHKGGPPSVVALQWLLDEGSLPIPARGFGFGELIAAQAGGDLKALRDAGRRVVRVANDASPSASVAALRRGLAAR